MVVVEAFEIVVDSVVVFEIAVVVVVNIDVVVVDDCLDKLLDLTLISSYSDGEIVF